MAEIGKTIVLTVEDGIIAVTQRSLRRKSASAWNTCDENGVYVEILYGDSWRIVSYTDSEDRTFYYDSDLTIDELRKSLVRAIRFSYGIHIKSERFIILDRPIETK